ncbi:MAG: pyrroline-5-carboxylate reductase [Acidimicrobiales bacterium]
MATEEIGGVQDVPEASMIPGNGRSMSSHSMMCIIGGGKMGSALGLGLLQEGLLRPTELAIVEKGSARRISLSNELPPGTVITGEVTSVAPPIEGLVLAVKPDDVEHACASIRDLDHAPQRVLSIVAGVATHHIESLLPAGIPVIRSMPNTPALVGAAVSAIAPGCNCSEEDIAWSERILGAVGATIRLQENALDAVTGLSGSGPAYVFLVAEALAEGGILMGLDRDTADFLVANTILGSAKLWLDTGESPATLRAKVTSPGGTTAAGLEVLEMQAVRSAMIEAVKAATERSRQLGE